MKLRIAMSAVILTSWSILAGPTTAFASTGYTPGQNYSVNSTFDCPDSSTDYSADVTIYDSNDQSVGSTSLSAYADSDDYGDCTSVNVAGDITVPSQIGEYTVSIRLYYGYGDLADSRSDSISVGNFQTNVSISDMTWEPGVRVDPAEAPSVTVRFDQYDSDSGSYNSNYCPSSIEVQYHKPGYGWRSLEVVQSSNMVCAHGDTQGYQLLRFQSPGRGYLRVAVDGHASEMAPIHYYKALKKFRFTQVWANTAKAKWVGDNAYINAFLEQQLENGAWVLPNVSNIHVKLSRFKNGSWKTVGTCKMRHGKWTWVDCGPVANAPGLKLRMSYMGAEATSKAYVAKEVTIKRLYLRDGWTTCNLFDGMSLAAGVKASNGNEWPIKTKIILQGRSSRFDSWTNLDYAYSTKTKWALLYGSDCYSYSYFRLYAPDYGLSLESGHYS